MQTETLKKLYDYLKKNKVTEFDIEINQDDFSIKIYNLGLEEVDSLEILQDRESDSIFLNVSKPL
jgi:hypothetical protein